MRRISAVLTSAALATGGMLATGGLAHAATDCGSAHGTVPVLPAKAYPIGLGAVTPGDATQYGTVYLYDEDYLDATDDNPGAHGFWIYVESNTVGDLQTGGSEVALGALPPAPLIAAGSVVPPHPGGLPLFPNGVPLSDIGGGSNLADGIGETDPCQDPTPGLASFDTVIF
jgi:hypothetical protein